MENTIPVKIDCVLDNLVLYIESVSVDAFDLLKDKLFYENLKGKLPMARLTIGKGRSEYHYRLNIGEGGGAITIGFKHNSAKPIDQLYTMRIEFNPQKEKDMHRAFFSLFNRFFAHHTKKVRQIDLAFDIGLDISNIFVYSLTGRTKSYFKNTQYFGSSGNHGRLKVYDKKAELEEKQGETIEEESKTRIEYTVKFEEAVTPQLFSKINLCINEDYKINVLTGDKLKGELKACILAVQENWVQMNEFTRTTKTKIKKALDSMNQLDLDHAFVSAKNNIVTLITSYFSIT